MLWTGMRLPYLTIPILAHPKCIFTLGGEKSKQKGPVSLMAKLTKKMTRIGNVAARQRQRATAKVVTAPQKNYDWLKVSIAVDGRELRSTNFGCLVSESHGSGGIQILQLWWAIFGCFVDLDAVLSCQHCQLMPLVNCAKTSTSLDWQSWLWKASKSCMLTKLTDSTTSARMESDWSRWISRVLHWAN